MNKKIARIIREYERENKIYLDGTISYSKDVINILNSNINGSDNTKELDTLFSDSIKRLFNCNNYILTKGSTLSLIDDKCLVINDNIKTSDGFNYEINDLIDYEEIRNIIKDNNIRVLFVGSKYYTRFIDYKKLSQIAHEFNCKFVVDISNNLEFVISKRLVCPYEYADMIIISRFNHILCMSNKELNISNDYLLKYKLGFLEYLLELQEFDIDKVVNNVNSLVRSFTDNNIYVCTSGSDNNLVSIKVNNGDGVKLLLDKNNIVVNNYGNRVIFNLVNNYLDIDYYELGNKVSKIIGNGVSY